jgi:predicted DNA-binding transcriptional regulator AlpA
MKTASQYILLKDLYPREGHEGYLPATRRTICEWIKQGHLPQPIKLGPRKTAFLRSEIEAFQRKLIENRNS